MGDKGESEMWLSFYGNVGILLGTLLFWWVLFFVLVQLKQDRKESGSWKIGLLLTFIQSLAVILLFPVIYDWLHK